MADADLIVIGAGPAGASAALAARDCGLDTLLIDENHAAGGQVYRPAPDTFESRDAARDPDKKAGASLRDRVRSSAVRTAFRHQVWSVGPGFRVDCVGPEGPVAWHAPALIVASGTTERVVPFPGWTLPGVIGLAGATIALKSQRALPGERTVVAGCGPLLLAVAAGILGAGGRVAAVIDLAGPSDWVRLAPAMARRPDLSLRGARWYARLRAHGVPVLHRHTVRAVEEGPQGLRVQTARVDDRGRGQAGDPGPVIEGDAVAVGHGLVPSTEITRLLGARHHYVRESGGWLAERDALGRTSVPQLFVAGDGAGIAGAVPAAHEGELAGLAAARDCGAIDQGSLDRRTRAPLRALRHAAPFGNAVARLMALRPAQVAEIPAATIVCRCEDVTRGEIDAAVDAGAGEVNQLKAWTRCGMGPCQGRTCGDVVGEIVARRVGDRAQAGLWTARVPLRPIPVDALTGDYGYADIPIPRAAPL